MRYREIHKGTEKDLCSYGEIIKAITNSTMSQRDVSAIMEIVGVCDSNDRINAQELEQLCTVAEVDTQEVFDLVGMKFH
jgi:hypothetical protein